MFFFGTAENTADTYLDAAVNGIGPRCADVHFEEMNEKELRDYFVYVRIAYFRALQDGAGDDVMEILVKYHDELFMYLLEVTDDLRGLVCSRRHQPIGDPEKYYKLAGCRGSAN